jgi:uncharacterized membrane protein
MDIFIVALLIVVLYLVLTIKTDLSKKIADLEFHITNLRALLKKALEEKETHTPDIKPQTPKAVAEDKPRMIPMPEAPKPEPAKPEIQVEQHQPTITPPDPMEGLRRPIQPPQQIHRPLAPKEPQPSFFERYPDLEKFIGENLINKIGIGILVLAIAYFVKYAIDNNWIGPVGRVGVGILCGSILIGFAHKLRKNYQAFSSVLAGGGLAIYYFTITLAFHQYALFSQTVAFIILIIITLFAVALALLYDKQELAIIALVGGMASPFMVSNGHNNFNAFFMYLVVLNGGLLIIAYYKAWRILNISAFGLTTLVYITVLFNLPTANDNTAFIYGTVFYLLFLAINIAHNVKEGKAFIASDYSILLINTALYFATGLYLLTDMGQPQYRGLFSAALGAVNLVISYILFKNKKVDTNILYLLIGITLTFISLTAPIQLHGNSITLFWSSEMVLLYWLYQKSGIKLMKATALLVWVLMLISLGMDWFSSYSDNSLVLPVIVNKGFVTGLYASVATFLLYLLVKRDTSEDSGRFNVSFEVLRGFAFILLFLSGLLEINHQFSNHYPFTQLNVVYLMLYVPLFIGALELFVLSPKKHQANPYTRAGLIAAAIGVYFIFITAVFDIQRMMLERHSPAGIHFLAHWFGAILIGLLFYRLIVILRDEFTPPDAASWIICAGIVAYLSLEFCLASNWLFTSSTYPLDRVETVYIQTALPVLWGLLSFAIMWLGMRHKQRTLRIISLSLFTLTLIKLFVFDIRNIPPAGKIAAFFCLGVLLLIVSFMYQKVKQIIVDDEDQAGKEN